MRITTLALAFEPVSGTLLVIEVKSVVPDIGGTLATLDRKVRLAHELAEARGWRVRTVGRLLVLPEARTARRRIDEHEATLRNAFPARNVEVNRWLRSPSGPFRASCSCHLIVRPTNDKT